MERGNSSGFFITINRVGLMEHTKNMPELMALSIAEVE
jgi:hypothetical protein